MNTISTHNEWDPLEEIIVGTAKNARIPIVDKSLHAVGFPNKKTLEIPTGRFCDMIVEETEEDLNDLSETLEKLDITVKRPGVMDQSKVFSTLDWESNGMYTYCPRDTLLTVGDFIIETPMALRARFLEPFAYKDILIEYLKNGARWISAPKPRLKNELYDLANGSEITLLNHEPVFDAANVLKFGKDILYLISNTGNELGCRWLQNVLGENYRVHACRNLYSSMHIDTTIVPLRPGLVLVHPERVDQENLPSILKKWEVIPAPEMVDIGCKIPLSSIWIGMNILSINPSLAIVDAKQVHLIKLLEKHKIDVVPLQLRHARTLGGGFHCVTLDVRRRGDLKEYCF